MAIQPVATLKANMPLGTAGGTSVQDIHDLVDVFDARTPINVEERGVQYGVGKSSAVRVANAAAIRQAVLDAKASGHIALICGTVEVEGVINLKDINGAFIGGVSMDYAKIVQFTDNVHIIDIGTTSTNGNSRVILTNLELTYNTVQPATNTNAIAIYSQNLWFSRIENIVISNVFTGLGGSAGTSDYFFSNIVKHIRINSYSGYGLRFYKGTGCTFENIYVSGGSANTFSTAITAFYFEELHQSSYIQINAEWATLNIAAEWRTCRGFTIIGMNNEGIRVTGSTQGFFKFSYGSLGTIFGLTLGGSSEGYSGGVQGIFVAESTCSIGVHAMRTGSLAPNGVGSLYLVYHRDSSYNNATFEFHNLDYDSTTTLTGFFRSGAATNGDATWRGAVLTKLNNMFNLDGAPTLVRDENYTYYNEVGNGHIIAATTLTADRDITISNLYNAGKCPTLDGMRFKITRVAGGAFDLRVKDHNGTTIATLPTANTSIEGMIHGGTAIILG